MLTDAEWEVIRLSLWVASWAVVLSLPFGIGMGYWLARTRSSWKWVVETVVNLTLVMPPVVTGYLLLLIFGRRGWLGAPLEDYFGIRLAFTWWGAVLAAAVVSFPLLVRSIRLAFQGVNVRLEMAARTLGATWWQMFLTVSLPLALRGIVAGAVLAFARSLGEFGATIMIAGNVEGKTRTIALAIYTLTERPGGMAMAARLVVFSVLIAAGALAVSELLERRVSRHEHPRN